MNALAPLEKSYTASGGKLGAIEKSTTGKSSPGYKFGFNGQEKDDEVFNAAGTALTAEFWEYDTRTGRRWNLDPVSQISISDYAAFGLNPIVNVDPNGAIFWEKKHIRQARQLARNIDGDFEKHRGADGRMVASVTARAATQSENGEVDWTIARFRFMPGQDRSDLLERSGGDFYDNMQASTSGWENIGWQIKELDASTRPGHTPPAAIQAFLSMVPPVAAANVYTGITDRQNIWAQEQSGLQTALNAVSIIPFAKIAQAGNAIRGVGLSDDVARTFQYGSYTRTTLAEPMKVFRYYDNVNAFAKGRFLTPSVSGFTFVDRVGLSLRPSWNQMTKVATWELPAGTTIFQGRAAMQFPWLGGKTQFFAPSLDGAKRLMH